MGDRLNVIILVSLSFIVMTQVLAQEQKGNLVDDRDGNTYRTIQIKETTWFQNNLKYETANSYYPKKTRKKSKVEKGNFYTYQDAQEVCPQDWRLPSEEDWLEYFSFLLENQKNNYSIIEIDTLHEEFISLVYRDSLGAVNLFQQTNPLNLQDYGWVQGRKIRPDGTMSYWIGHSKVEDKRFHVHLRKNNYTMHRHKHHVNDVKRKRRMFMVRCVKD